MENSNVYEKPVTLKNILKFAVPTIAMTVFMSFYTDWAVQPSHHQPRKWIPLLHLLPKPYP